MSSPITATRVVPAIRHKSYLGNLDPLWKSYFEFQKPQVWNAIPIYLSNLNYKGNEITYWCLLKQYRAERLAAEPMRTRIPCARLFRGPHRRGGKAGTCNARVPGQIKTPHERHYWLGNRIIISRNLEFQTISCSRSCWNRCDVSRPRKRDKPAEKTVFPTIARIQLYAIDTSTWWNEFLYHLKSSQHPLRVNNTMT